MSDKPYREEYEAIRHLAPPLNQAGADAAEASGLNALVKAQLFWVNEQLIHYLPTRPRGWGSDDQMPHEWGSLDTYDDMRSALHIAGDLLDALLDHDGPPDEAVWDVLKDRNLGGAAPALLEAVGFDENNEAHWDRLGMGLPDSTPSQED